MTLLIFIVVAWSICATITASITLGYFQRKFPSIAKDEYRTDLSMGWFFGLFFGPAGLLMSFFLSGFCQYGLINPFVLNKYKGEEE